MKKFAKLTFIVGVVGSAGFAAIAAFAQVIPDPIPDRVVALSEPLLRGEVLRTPAAAIAPTPKTIDGDPGDWVSESSRIGGSVRFHAGEHVYADFVHDAWGADDGDDAARLALTGEARETEDRLHRFDALFQALGDQFGAPGPIGADDSYGDVPGNDVADLSEVRWSAGSVGGEDVLDLMLQVTSLEDATALGVLVLADTDDAPSAPRLIPGTPLTTTRHDVAVLIRDGLVSATSLAAGGALPAGNEAIVNATGFVNTLEARIPQALLTGPDGVLRVALVAGRIDGANFIPLNVAYRDGEAIAGMYNDQLQAIALLEGSIDAFTEEIDTADLRAGRSEGVRPGTGYHERIFRSVPEISAEFRSEAEDVYEDSLWQRYALYIPTNYQHGTPHPLTMWMHYRGGKAHSAGAWSPRLITQLGEEQGNLVISPHGRGPVWWYEGSSHQDVWEAFEDAHALLSIDPRRRSLSGYSMGGYGTVLFGFLYPDLFSAGYSQAGAVGWHDLAVNARHLPIWFDISSQDTLLLTNRNMADRLDAEGYRYVFNQFLSGEHYTQAVLDEWAGGARYLNEYEAPVNPRRVTYRVSLSVIETINDGRGQPSGRNFLPDGAWWVDGITVRDAGSDTATVDAEAESLPGDDVTPGPYLEPPTPGDYSSAFVRTGQVWNDPVPAPLANRLTTTLTNVGDVSFDLNRLALDWSTPLKQIDVVSDGPSDVRLVGVPPEVGVSAPGASVTREGATAIVSIPGDTQIELLPEPGAWGALLVGGATLAGLSRRSRRRG